MSDRDDLRRAIDDLETAMRDLQAELENEATTQPTVPQLPSVYDLLRFADQAAIPAAVAVLEANIQILKSIQQAIRIAEGIDRAETDNDRGQQLASLGEETLTRLTRSLDDLQRLIEAGSLPQEETARSILTDARDLQDQLESQTDQATETATDQPAEEDSDEVTIDIDAELESIKDEYTDESEEDDASSDDEEED